MLFVRMCAHFKFYINVFIVFCFILFALLLSALGEHNLPKTPLIITDPYDGFKTTCSQDADRRGSNQKVFSFSLFGNFLEANMSRRYLKPLEVIAAEINNYFPGW